MLDLSEVSILLNVVSHSTRPCIAKQQLKYFCNNTAKQEDTRIGHLDNCDAIVPRFIWRRKWRVPKFLSAAPLSVVAINL